MGGSRSTIARSSGCLNNHDLMPRLSMPVVSSEKRSPGLKARCRLSVKAGSALNNATRIQSLVGRPGPPSSGSAACSKLVLLKRHPHRPLGVPERLRVSVRRYQSPEYGIRFNLGCLAYQQSVISLAIEAKTIPVLFQDLFRTTNSDNRCGRFNAGARVAD